MKTVSVSEARRRLPVILRDVQSGHTYVLVRRGTPVARIEPFDRGEPGRAAARAMLIARLKSQPPTDIAAWTRDELYD